jgi:hypothetical protein
MVMSGFVDDFLPRESAARLLGLSVRQLARLVEDGHLVKYRDGMGHVWYARREVEALRHSRCQIRPVQFAG